MKFSCRRHGQLYTNAISREEEEEGEPRIVYPATCCVCYYTLLLSDEAGIQPEPGTSFQRHLLYLWISHHRFCGAFFGLWP